MAQAGLMGWVPLWQLLKEDFRQYSGNFSRPGYQALLFQRLAAWVSLRRMAGGPLKLWWDLLFGVLETVRILLIRNVYGIELHYGTHFGRRLLISHQHGITVHHLASFGDDCVLHHNVTIGRGSREQRGAAQIGNRVEIGPGAVLLGAITIGDDVVIAPNALVMTDVPAGSHVVSTPGRVLRLGGTPSASAPQRGDAVRENT